MKENAANAKSIRDIAQEALQSMEQPEAPDTGDARRFVTRCRPQYEIRCGDEQDTVANRYRINAGRPLPELSGIFADAFSADDLKAEKNAPPIYALVMKQGVPCRMHAVNALCHQSVPCFTEMSGYEIIPFSKTKDRRLALILRRPDGVTLRTFLDRNGAMPEAYIEEALIRPVAAAIGALRQAGVTHGNINPDSIFIDGDGKLMLSECFSAPCGYFQTALYENLLRAEATPYGKGGHATNIDYYALGVLCAEAMSEGFLSGDDDDVIDRKFGQGAYRMLAADLKLSRRMHDFFRGTLNEHPPYLWGSEQIEQWLNGRRFNLLPPKLPLRLQRPVQFTGRKYYNVRHLAFAMGRDWDEAKRFLADSESVRWLERSIESEYVQQKLFMLHSRLDRSEDMSPAAAERVTENDKITMQFLITLDPDGPFRLREFAVRPSGLGVMLAESIADPENTRLAEVTALFLSPSVIGYWSEEQSEYTLVEMEEYLYELRKASQTIRAGGAEGKIRALYDLNPSLPCRSPLAENLYLLSAEEMMLMWEKGDIRPDITAFDAHLVAFLTNRVNIPKRPEMTKLAAFPVFAKNQTVLNALLLASVQRMLSLPPMPAACDVFHEQLTKLTDAHFHSRELRSGIRAALDRVKGDGSMHMIMEVIGVPRYHILDKVGFRRAQEEYARNVINILNLSDKHLIKKTGTRYGLSLSIIFTYSLTGLALAALIIKAFN